jgi:biopolymer transport protein ExbB
MHTLFIILLGLLSIVSLAYIIERGLALRWRKVIPREIAQAVAECRSVEDLSRFRWTCESHDSPIGRLLLMASDHIDWPKADTAGLLETRARHEVSRLERGLVVLEIIVGIAPLMGLVGTIFGLIMLFGGMDQLSADKTGQFAQGISLALNATLLGLIIAIPSLIAWSYYSKKVETVTVEMESLCDEFLRKTYRYAATTNVEPNVVDNSPTPPSRPRQATGRGAQA